MPGQCSHPALDFDGSPHAVNTRYKRIDENRRIAVTTKSGRTPNNLDAFRVAPATFPGPLILPGDDLALDGRYPAQSVRSWFNEEHRNDITTERSTVYVVAPPIISDHVAYMQGWSTPQVSARKTSRVGKSKKARGAVELAHPRTEDVVEYFSAFFHGLTVRSMHQSWRFTAWETSDRPQRKDQRDAVALETHESAVRIRTRTSLDGCFDRQLNLSDLLDACLEAVPADAYAILLLVEQDMFEDEDDDFCCGRAFGGSRVAVVSTARYHPLLDDWQGVERDHAWPASHCANYINALCESADVDQERKIFPASQSASPSLSAMQATVSAHVRLPSLINKPSNAALEGLWLGRVCKAGAHEVGHCLGMDHCVYYACLMQGTSNICEDARQPPFLCPVDLAKYVAATEVDVLLRYEALLAFCEARPTMHWCAAFAAWLTVRLAGLRS